MRRVQSEAARSQDSRQVPFRRDACPRAVVPLERAFGPSAAPAAMGVESQHRGRTKGGAESHIEARTIIARELAMSLPVALKNPPIHRRLPSRRPPSRRRPKPSLKMSPADQRRLASASRLMSPARQQQAGTAIKRQRHVVEATSAVFAPMNRGAETQSGRCRGKRLKRHRVPVFGRPGHDQAHAGGGARVFVDLEGQVEDFDGPGPGRRVDVGVGSHGERKRGRQTFSSADRGEKAVDVRRHRLRRTAGQEPAKVTRRGLAIVAQKLPQEIGRGFVAAAALEQHPGECRGVGQNGRRRGSISTSSSSRRKRRAAAGCPSPVWGWRDWTSRYYYRSAPNTPTKLSPPFAVAAPKVPATEPGGSVAAPLP